MLLLLCCCCVFSTSHDAACAGDLNHVAVAVLLLCVLMMQLVLGL